MFLDSRLSLVLGPLSFVLCHSPSALYSLAPDFQQGTKDKGLMTILLNINVLPPDSYAAARVDLQGDHAVGELRRGISVIDDPDAVQMSHDVFSADRYLEIVPLADGLEGVLAFRRRLDHPAAPAALIQPAGVVADIGVNFDLHAFDVRSMTGIEADDPSMDEDAAVSSLFSLEAETQVEVAVSLLCSQVAVFVVRALAEYRAVL